MNAAIRRAADCMVIAEEAMREMDGTIERLMAAWRDVADKPRTKERDTSSLSTHSDWKVSPV